MNDWKLFTGEESPHDRIRDLPPPPKWRQFDSKHNRGAAFLVRPEEVDLVNAALYLRRPLLITGKPGTGKTSLAHAVAHELRLGEVLTWAITTRTTLKDGLYRYDAIGRAQDTQRQEEDSLENIGNYIQLGPLGTALLPSDRPRALLIDEIDKSDIDLPNDLLHVFEEGTFEIPELTRIKNRLDRPVTVSTSYTDENNEITGKDRTFKIEKGRVPCKSFPFVILTSNGERDFPPAFLRRCLRLNMREPDQEMLEKIVQTHLQQSDVEHVKDLIQQFMRRRSKGNLATDQLLNAVYLVTQERSPVGSDKERLIEQVLKYLDSDEDA